MKLDLIPSLSSVKTLHANNICLSNPKMVFGSFIICIYAKISDEKMYDIL